MEMLNSLLDNPQQFIYDMNMLTTWTTPIRPNRHGSAGAIVHANPTKAPPSLFFSPRFISAIRAGKAADVLPTMASDIEEAGFVDIHEKTYKWPIGPWPRDKRFKDAGMVNMNHWMTGVEGWCMWLFTKFGSPTPWSKEEVYVYCAMVRNEIKNPQLHAYHLARRVWARKPFPGEFSKQPPERVTRSDKAS